MAIVRMRRDPNKRVELSAEAKARLDAMTPKEIEANALSDPDNPPATEEELLRGVTGRRVRRSRQALGLTQEQFAERFQIPIGTLRDWEQGRRMPEAPALAYLSVIERETEAVDRALAALS